MEKSEVTVDAIVSRQQVTGYTPETLDTSRKLLAEVGEWWWWWWGWGLREKKWGTFLFELGDRDKLEAAKEDIQADRAASSHLPAAGF